MGLDKKAVFTKCDEANDGPLRPRFAAGAGAALQALQAALGQRPSSSPGIHSP